MRLAFCLLLLCSAPALFARPHVAWSHNARMAYQKTLQLRFDEATNYLFVLEQKEPENYARLLIEDYRDFFTIYINEDPAEFARLEANRKQRLERVETIPESDPWSLYLQADIRLHWALARLKFEEYTKAFFEVNKAFKLLSKNAELFPDFLPNKKDLGILHAVVGTIPDNYKWAVEWLSSVEGTIEQGGRELREVLQHAQSDDFIFDKEIQVLYAYFLLHLEKKPEEAWQIIQKSGLDAASSPMDCFVLANIAQQTGRNDRAINFLQQRPTSLGFYDFPYLDFMLGVCKSRRLDQDAGRYFKRFLDRFQGQNFIKEAYMRLGWHHLVQGNEAGYWEAMANCMAHGFTNVGSDKSAQLEAESGRRPHVQLLKARQLFDGGYFKQALSIIEQVTPPSLTSKHDQLEYRYRYGRILHALGRSSEALQRYRQTIAEGRDEPWYYACRAALEAGHIYESQQNWAKAEEHFKECLSIKPDEHATGLHQSAKAGLNRLKSH